MRFRLFDVDVTPEEIATTPELRELLRSVIEGGRVGVVTPPSPASESLPRSLVSVLDTRSPGGLRRAAAEQLLASALEWEGVEARVGVSRRNKDDLANAIRLHRRGSGVGAFLSLAAPTLQVMFRLPKSHSLEGFQFSRARDVQAAAPYGVSLRLQPEALPEAMTLARQAYEAAASESVDRRHVTARKQTLN
jgi:hypothetical protein